jgi:hypothetical protein
MIRRSLVLPRLALRRFGSHAAEHAHASDAHLSPAAAQYQATHAVLFGEVRLLLPEERLIPSAPPVIIELACRSSSQHVTPGVPRTREAWEKWNWLLLGGTAFIVYASTFRPNTNPHDWARDEAEERLRRREVRVAAGRHSYGLPISRWDGSIVLCPPPCSSIVMCRPSLLARQAGLEVLPGVNYASIRYMREHGIISTEEADALEGGHIPPIPAPAPFRNKYSVEPLMG